MSIPFSVVTSVYKNDKPEYVKIALDSMLVNQTIKPAEVVLVVDGPIHLELTDLINAYQKQYSSILHPIFLETNQGLGHALQVGVSQAKHEYIARMDSDDICLPNRFESQLLYLLEHPNIDVISGHIEEFIDNISNIVGKRVVPLYDNEIYHSLKYRCPFNHVATMFKKASIMQVGNYQDWHYNEDYYLWIRMALANCKFANLDQTLCYVRVGKEMYQRRGGWKYFKSEYGLQKYMLNHNLINSITFVYNVIIRFVVQVLMPNRLRGWVFQKIARKQK
jgi:glycosyltransferase involved in cell wall biosynthesis